MRFDDTHPAGRIHRANDDLYPYPMHREQHAWVKPSDCEHCAGEDYRNTQAYAAQERARELAHLDADHTRQDHTLARLGASLLFLTLALIGVAAGTHPAVTIACALVMLALIPTITRPTRKDPS